MAKLTVHFKSKEVDSYLFDNKIVHIGRDDTNDIQIDSLAVAPAHAAIIIRDGAATAKQLNDEFPLIVNGQITQHWSLENDDTLTLGKHSLVYQSTPEQSPVTEPEKALLLAGNTPLFEHQESHDALHLPNASLQVLDGPNIGKVVALKKAMTRLGNENSGIVVISRRRDGYFMSALKNNGTITVNKKPINESYLRLQKNDILSINNISLQFFID